MISYLRFGGTGLLLGVILGVAWLVISGAQRAGERHAGNDIARSDGPVMTGPPSGPEKQAEESVDRLLSEIVRSQGTSSGWDAALATIAKVRDEKLQSRLKVELIDEKLETFAYAGDPLDDSPSEPDESISQDDIDRAINVAAEISDSTDRATALHAIAEAQRQRGDSQAADESLASAATLAAEAGNRQIASQQRGRILAMVPLVFGSVFAVGAMLLKVTIEEIAKSFGRSISQRLPALEKLAEAIASVASPPKGKIIVNPRFTETQTGSHSGP